MAKIDKHKVQTYIFISLGILFVVIGISRGEVEVVLSKAIQLCLECVGIG